MDLHSLSMCKLRDLISTRKVSVTEVVKSYIGRIERIDPELNSCITVLKEESLRQAALLDRADSDLGAPLAGIPIAVKDLLCMKGIRTTCCSKILENYRPPYNATTIELLRSAGSILIAKTNMDEFAMGSSNESSAFGTVHNPWDLTRVPGGSSGGSAAAVAAELCAGALGTDTGGSIRQPASFCGVVGLKPTYGRVSRFGLIAFASSLDQAGPLTRTVEDSALLLQVMAGYDRRDSTSVNCSVPDYGRLLREPIRGLRLGIPKEYFVEGIEPDVLSAVRNAIEIYRAMGVELVDVSLPHTDYAVAAYYIIAPAEASSNLARYDGVKYGLRVPDAKDLSSMYRRSRSQGFGTEVKRRIMLGTYVLSSGYYDAYYLKASQVRTLIREDFRKAFEKCDALLTPVAPTAAFRIGEKSDDPLTMYLNDVFTLPASLAGIPGISIPCGFNSDGLPIGLQVLGPHFREDTVLQVAWQFENATEFHTRRPEIAAQ